MDTPQTLTFRPSSWDDFERLLALRIRTMRESLERLGRFDADRARARSQAGFHPDQTRLAFLGDAFVGCVTVRPDSPSLSWIEHFYIEPDHQGRGVGGLILQRITDDADRENRTLRLGVLKESDANRFYRRHGFAETHREEWDIFYERPPRSLSV